MGIGTLPALTALVIYAIFRFYKNTITGLKGIDPSLQEAGIAFGMTRWERLKKFEIPLAMPVIMSGIRTAAVLIIGTATFGDLDWGRGLGSFILLGIDRNNASLILIGALSSAVLAIAFNFLLKVMEKRNCGRFSLVLPWWLYYWVCLIVQPFWLKREGKLGYCWENRPRTRNFG